MITYSRIRRLLALLTCSLALTLPLPTALRADESVDGDGKKQHHLSMLFPKYQDYLELAEERQMHFAPIYRLSMKEGRIETVEVSFEFDGRPYRFSPTSEGFVTFRPSRDMLRADPNIQVRNAAPQMTLNLQMEILAGLRLRYDMAELHRNTHDAWSEAKKLGGLLSVFAPKHSRMQVLFDDNCPDARWSVTDTNEAEVAGGTAEKGVAIVNFRDRSVRHAWELTLACVPLRLMLEP